MFHEGLTFDFEVLAIPSSRTQLELPHYSDVSKLTFETMKYIGPTIPGGPDVELWGTAKVWLFYLSYKLRVTINISRKYIIRF